ncbi:MAG: hypothetical protein LBH31_07160 [Burkholderiaceae bacterium]|nr:hypothetical protein [Burkholderiaceae bacterium]
MQPMPQPAAWRQESLEPTPAAAVAALALAAVGAQTQARRLLRLALP